MALHLRGLVILSVRGVKHVIESVDSLRIHVSKKQTQKQKRHASVLGYIV